MTENNWRATRSRRSVKVGSTFYVLCHFYKSADSEELCDFRRHGTVDGIPVCQRHLYRIVHYGDPYASPVVDYASSREPRYGEDGTVLNPRGGPQVETLFEVFEQAELVDEGTGQTVPKPARPESYTPEEDTSYYVGAPEPVSDRNEPEPISEQRQDVPRTDHPFPPIPPNTIPTTLRG